MVYSKLRKYFSSLPEDTLLLIYLFISIFGIWIIFDPIKYMWSDDPFQKVILAPLGEEPFKLLLAFAFCIIFYFPIYWRNRGLKNITLITVFYYVFIPASIISATIFGVNEGPIGNILLHFSTTTIGAILLVTTYKKIKDNEWKTFYKLSLLISILGIPMFFHSISNQYTNISVADNHPEFNYLVTIAGFLKENTF
ncbi:MAG TPA: hypothetical protein ENI44_04075, partial [Thermoplasmatales archaeon]|nr:hypothetical protein [Thermoplasmatales archaeon]